MRKLNLTKIKPGLCPFTPSGQEKCGCIQQILKPLTLSLLYIVSVGDNVGNCFVNVGRMRLLKALSESHAVYADASHYHVSSAGQRETSYLCQYDSSLPLCDHHSPTPAAGLYRYTHICAAAPTAGPPSSPAIVYATTAGGRGCDQQLLHPG